jgi:hypothetical protein
MDPAVVPIFWSCVLSTSCPTSTSTSLLRPCVGPGACAFGVAVGAGVVVRWRTCYATAASWTINGMLVFVTLSVIPLSVAASMAKLAMASTMSCWNSVLAACATLYPAPMAVFFVRRYVLCALVKWALRLFQFFSIMRTSVPFSTRV